MRRPWLSRAAARLVLQEEWDEAAVEFAGDVALMCDDEPRHVAADLVCNLDDCRASDNDAGTNFTYGQLLLVLGLARRLDVNVEWRWPERMSDG